MTNWNPVDPESVEAAMPTGKDFPKPDDAAKVLNDWRDRLRAQSATDGAQAITEHDDRETAAWTMTVLHGLANLDATEAHTAETNANAAQVKAITTLIQVVTLAVITSPFIYAALKIIQAFR